MAESSRRRSLRLSALVEQSANRVHDLSTTLAAAADETRLDGIRQRYGNPLASAPRRTVEPVALDGLTAGSASELDAMGLFGHSRRPHRVSPLR
jgi:hypothetical protein